MGFVVRILILVFSTSLVAMLASAKSSKVEGSEPLVSGQLILSTSTNSLSVDDENGIELFGSYGAEVALQLPKLSGHKQNIGAFLGYVVAYTHEFEGERAGDFLDPRLSYSFVAGDFGIFKKLILGISGLAPANKETTITSMRGAVGPFVAYEFDLGKVRVVQRWSYRHAWFEYDTEPNGRMNFPDVFSIRNNLNWNISRVLSLGVLAALIYSVDYNRVDKSGTEIGFDVGYQVTKNFSASLGVLTRSGTLAASGDYHRVNFYDPGRAIGSLDLAYAF